MKAPARRIYGRGPQAQPETPASRSDAAGEHGRTAACTVKALGYGGDVGLCPGTVAELGGKPGNLSPSTPGS